jgi:hypothetical protein
MSSSLIHSLIVGTSLLAASQWALGAGLDFNSSDGSESKVVFSYAFPPRLETYDLEARQWMAPKAMSSSPVVVAIDGNLVFVGTSERVVVVDLQTGVETFGPEVTNIRAIDVIGNRLFVATLGQIQVYDKTTMNLLATGAGWYSTFSNIATTPAMDRIAYSLLGISPADVAWLLFNPTTNSFGTTLESPYHGAFSIGPFNWFSADGDRMLNSGGVVYQTSDLTFLGAVGAAVDQAFTQDDGFIVRTGSVIRKLNGNGLPTGYYPLPGAAKHLHRNSIGLVGFYDAGGALASHHMAFTDVQSPQRPNPSATLGVVDFVIPASGARFALIDRANQTVHVYDRRRREVVQMFGLSSSPVSASIRKSDDTLFVGYAGGLIHSVELDTPGAPEVAFAATSLTPGSIVATDGLLFTCDGSGAWASHWVFANNGELVNWQEWNHCTSEFEWHGPTRRLFQYTAFSPTDVEWERYDLSGQLIGSLSAPSHGGIGFGPPLRANPLGSLLFTGTGQVFDAASLNILGSIAFTPVDMAWGNTTMWVADDDRLHKLDSNFVSELSLPLGGNAKRLLSDGKVLTAISLPSNASYKVTVVSDADASGADVEVGAGSVVNVDAGTLEVTVANLARSGSVTPELAISLPAGASVVSWTCAAFDGAQCNGASGAGLPVPGPLAAQGYLRFELQLDLTAAALQASGTISITAPGDSNPDNNVVTFTLVALPLFLDGFE